MARGWKYVYTTIKQGHYDAALVHNIRILESLYKKQAQKENDTTFLRRCKKEGIIPNHLKLRNYLSSRLGTSKRLDKLHLKTEKKYLKEEIIKTFQDRSTLLHAIKTARTNIRTSAPSLWPDIAHLLNNSYEITFNKCKNRQISKFQTLLEQEMKILCQSIEMNASPSMKQQTVLDMRENHDLTEDETKLLELGFNYALPHKDVTDRLIHTMYAIEGKMSALQTTDTLANYVRNGVTKIINQEWKPNMAIIQWKPWIVTAIKSIKNRRNIIITKADKNNCVVIMDKQDYDSKMINMLTVGPYQTLTNDPTEEYTNKVSSIIKNLINSNHLSEQQGKTLTPRSPKCPQIYGSPKTHKPDCPLRPIVDYRSSPTYHIAKFLANILKMITDDHPYNVSNSREFVSKLQEQKVKRGYKKISLDVQSLFTNVPIDITLELTKNRLEESHCWTKYTSLEIPEIMELLYTCVKCTYFRFEDQVYYQLDGTAMGSPVSPVFAEIFLQKLEIDLIPSIPRMTFYKRYVDDSYAHVHERSIRDILAKFNSYHSAIQFTIEEEKYNESMERWELPYLDIMTYSKADQTVGHHIYRKETFVNTYLRYSSFHPNAHKIGVVDTLLTRAITLCDDDNVENEIQNVFNMLTEREYPIKLLQRRLNIVKEKHISGPKDVISTPANPSDDSPLPDQIIHRIILPYFGPTSEKIASFLRFSLGVEIGYFPGIKLKTILANSKHKETNKNIGIYEISCKGNGSEPCDLVYIGETGVGLEERFQQHLHDVSRDNPQSAVAAHISTTGHQLDHIRLLEYEARIGTRKTKESLYIRAVDKTMNKNNGQKLHPIWSSRLVDFFKYKYDISKEGG